MNQEQARDALTDETDGCEPLDDAALEKAARAFALSDSTAYILATSDSSQLGHANDGAWKEYLEHVGAAVETYLSCAPKTAPSAPPVMAGAVTDEMIEAACKADLPDLWSDDPRTAHMAASPLRLECVRGEHRKGVANVLTAALSVARADGWRPIETAPKDGSDIELLLQNGEQFKVRWNTERYCVLGPRAGSYPPGWSAASTEDVDANLPISFAGNEPTHWRPAAPPALTGETQ